MHLVRRLAPPLFTIVTLSAFACGDPAHPADDHAASDAARLELPTSAPDIRGTITAVEARRIRVEEVPAEQSGSAKASVAFDDRTPILRRAGGRATADALVQGAVVSVWFTGPVAESYPVQARARAIVVE